MLISSRRQTLPNRNSPPAILLREGWREGKKTCKRTFADLSDWPKHKIETLQRLLRDGILVSPADMFETERTLPHGHVEAVLGTIADDSSLTFSRVPAATDLQKRAYELLGLKNRDFPCIEAMF